MAISRVDLTEKILKNDRICSRHFRSGKPADLLEDNNPDWLPSMNLGHRKKLKAASAANEARRRRLERAQARQSRQEAAQSLLLLTTTSEVEPETNQTSEGGENATTTSVQDALFPIKHAKTYLISLY